MTHTSIPEAELEVFKKLVAKKTRDNIIKFIRDNKFGELA